MHKGESLGAQCVTRQVESVSLPESHDRMAMPPQSRIAKQETNWVSLLIAVQFVTKLVRGLVIPKLVSPRLYGLYSSLVLVYRYGLYSDVGMSHLVAKRLPSVLANEGDESFNRELGRAFSWTLITTGLFALAVAGLGLRHYGADDWFYRIGFPILAGTIFVQQFRLLLGNAARAREWFRVLAVGEIIFSVAALFLAVGLLLLFGVLGLVASMLVAQVIATPYYLRHLSWPRFRRIPLGSIKSLAAGGTVLLLLAAAELVLTTIDQVFVLGFFSKEEFGIYSLGLFVSTTALSLSGIYLTIINPMMMRLVAAGEEEQAHRLMNQALVAYLAMLIVALPIGYLGLYGFIRSYLPDYSSGLLVFFLFSGMAIVRGPVLLLQPYFIARGDERKIVVVYVVSIILAAVLDAVVILSSGGLFAILSVSVVVYLLLNGALLLAFERRSAEPIERTKYVLIMLGLFIVAFFLITTARLPESGSLGGALVQVSLTGLFASLFTFIVLWSRRAFILHSLRVFWRNAAV